MTSLNPPDYEFQIQLELDEFKQLSGADWEVKIYSTDWQRAKNAMAIIPNSNVNNNGRYRCWIWSAMRCNLYECNNLSLSFISMSDKLFLAEPSKKVQLKSDKRFSLDFAV